MKLFNLFAAVLLTFNTIHSKALANACAALFDSAEAKNLELSEAITKNAGDVLLDIFEQILNAPDNSIVKIYSKTIKNDGIGALLLLVSVNESRKGRGLKFEFNLEDSNSISRIHSLYAERSTNKVHFSDSSTIEKFRQESAIVVQNKDYMSIYKFNGDLTSESLKDASQRGPIPVKYEGRNMLRASPFRDVEGIQQAFSEGMDLATKDFLSSLGGTYSLNHKSKINMTEVDIYSISQKADDLALQLYIHKKGSAPKESLDSLQILRAAL